MTVSIKFKSTDDLKKFLREIGKDDEFNPVFSAMTLTGDFDKKDIDLAKEFYQATVVDAIKN